MALFMGQNLKKILLQIQSYEDMPFLGPKYPNLSRAKFLVQTIIITFIYHWPFSLGKIYKKFLQRIQSYEDVPFFGPAKWSICPNFFWKTINITLIYLLAPFIVQSFWKILSADPELQDAQFPPNFREPVNEPWFLSFMPTNMPKIIVRYLSVGEILKIEEYWNLIGQEQFLATYNLRTRYFPSIQFLQNVHEP